MSTHQLPSSGTNLAILVGTISRVPEVRPLPSGDDVLTIELTLRPSEGPAESVPVAWFAAPPAAATWPAGEEVVVIGRVRRRFFRAGGRHPEPHRGGGRGGRAHTAGRHGGQGASGPPSPAQL